MSLADYYYLSVTMVRLVGSAAIVYYLGRPKATLILRVIAFSYAMDTASQAVFLARAGLTGYQTDPLLLAAVTLRAIGPPVVAWLLWRRKI